MLELLKSVYIFTNKYVCDKINKIEKIPCGLMKIWTMICSMKAYSQKGVIFYGTEYLRHRSIIS